MPNFINNSNSTRKWITVFIVLLFSYFSEGVIYRLNDTEYLRMPPVYQMDDYESCVRAANGTYCYAHVTLVSDTPSDLLHMIQEYSEHTSNHFNHTQLRHGICLTKTCKHFMQENKVLEQRLTLERCLNESLWRDYRLKARVTKNVYCTKLDEPMQINIGDICAAVFFICLGVLNIIGSLYDVYFNTRGGGNRLLLSFSLKQNFKKLTAVKNMDPLQERLKGLHGIKTLTMIVVIFGHAPLPLMLNAENPHDIEQMYYSVWYQPSFNGILIIQIFFIITGCLLAYNYREHFANKNPSWIVIPKAIIMRWIRLTPANAVVLIFTLTWFRFMASGPLWGLAVNTEVENCRQNGWWNMVYLNNYIDNPICLMQTWFLAVNMQLCILGVLVCFLAKTPTRRNVMLSALFIIGFIIPPLHTYFQDLDAIVLAAPQAAADFFMTDRTHAHSYKRGHTNLPAFVLGLAIGNIIYDGLRDEKKMEKYRKLRVLYYLTSPICFAIVVSGVVFYQDQPRPSIYLRTVLSALYRPLFALFIAIMFIGMAFKFENLNRRILEWRGWQTPSKLTYSTYLIHCAIIRIYAGMNVSLLHFGMAQNLKETSAMIFMSYVIAYPFWLFVEAPLNQALLIILGLSKEAKKYEEKLDIENTTTTITESESKGSVVMDIIS